MNRFPKYPVLVLLACVLAPMAQHGYGAENAETEFQLRAKPPFTLTTNSGKVYEKTRIVAVDPDGLRIMHSEGAGKVPFAELNDELRKAGGYNAQEARKHETAQAKGAVQMFEQQDATTQQTEFTNLHRSVLTALQTPGADLNALQASLQQAITNYRLAGKVAWVNILELDRDSLQQAAVQRSNKEAAEKLQKLTAANQQLQQQLAQANAQQTANSTRSLSSSGLYRYGSNALSPNYYYYNSRPGLSLYYYSNSSSYRTPLRTQPSAYLGNDRNGTGAGGYVPPSMQSGLDAHGGYTPPSLR